ncbi:MAG: metallophosphoesterase [Candidatus Thermoplasmatota archaeon]|nr:metallophosphoesterase [Candidatus Thermoplasmatota archaeon]MBU1941991.1 metallophosphoesterase [Candidatus Thermoplasmatota archaeon]
MVQCIFVSDLHGKKDHYNKLISLIDQEHFDGVFFGGDLLPRTDPLYAFVQKHIIIPLKNLKKKGLKTRFFVILGNDDPRMYEPLFLEADKNHVIDYVHNQTVRFGEYFVTGYAYVPPSPFLLKDWERYDVSRYVDIGSVAPDKGYVSVDRDFDQEQFETIAADMKILKKQSPPKKTIYLFHTPPYNTMLDRTALDGKMVDNVPLDVHTGSIAVRRFIEKAHPFVTLHGHIHEASRLTGVWHEVIGSTHMFSAAYDGPQLAVVRFDTENLGDAVRELL